VMGVATGNPILGNAVSSNGGLGIDLGSDGVTPNDAGDTDTGPNNLQNYPVLSAAATDGAGSADFVGSLDSAPSTTYRVEFFASAAADPSGFGEGERYLGFANVATDTAGNAVIDVSLATALTVGEFVTATATDPSNNTSELGAAIQAIGSQADLSLAKTDDVDPAPVGGLLTYTLTVTNAGPFDATAVVLTDALIPEMDFDSATSSQGGCAFDVPSRVLTCTLGTIPFPGSAVVTLTVRPMAVGTFVNSASVSGGEPDPAPGNDTADETTTFELPSEGVRFFTVTSTSETNVLEWVNPSLDYVSTEIVFRTDRFPSAPGEVGSTTLVNGGTAGSKDRYVHDTGPGSNGQTHYYGAFVHRSAAPVLSKGRFCSGRPFDNVSGSVKWAFNTGVFSLTPPTVSGASVIAPSNDHALYAMKRGPGGGEWPAGWRPALFGGPVQSRSPVVPVTVNGKNPVVFAGAQDGAVYAVDGTVGGATSFPWLPIPIAATTVQAAPAGLFTAFGGDYDYLLVGTRDDLVDNALVAIDPFLGTELARFTNGGGGAGIGIIGDMAVVDYATSRVYFASHARSGGSSSTLWCLKLASASPGPVFTLDWKRDLGDISSSPVLRGGRVYVGSALGGGTVFSIDADGGDVALDRTFSHGDGQVKGFIFPDRASQDLYFATGTRVWGVSDTADPMPDKFSGGVVLAPGVTPSPVLFVPGSHYVYVGGSDGRLYELDVLGSPPSVNSVALGDGLSTVGGPSLDWWYSLVHVGTEAGIFYAVESPLLPGGMCVSSCSGQPNGTACSCFSATPCTKICESGLCSDGGGC